MIPPWAVMKVKGCGLWTIVTKPALSRTAAKPVTGAPSENVFDVCILHFMDSIKGLIHDFFFFSK